MLNVNEMLNNIRVDQRTVLGLCAALGLALGIFFIVAIWQWHSDWVLAHDKPVAKTTLPKDTRAELIATLPNAHLFGQSINGGEVPISNLQLHVTGIVKIEGNAASKAYISIAGQPSKIYQAGDSLPYGVKVYEINNDLVILENGGHLEKLPLTREKLEFKPRSSIEDY